MIVFKKTIRVIAVLVLGLISTSTSSFIRHHHYHHHHHLNLCKECTEMRRDIITKTLMEIQDSKLCIQRTHNYGPIEQNTVTITQDDMLPKIEEFALEIKILSEAWKRYLGSSMCLQENISKYLTRIMCLLRPVNYNEEGCVVHHRVQEPLGYSGTLEAYVRFLKKMEGTLNGFLDS